MYDELKTNEVFFTIFHVVEFWSISCHLTLKIVCIVEFEKNCWPKTFEIVHIVEFQNIFCQLFTKVLWLFHYICDVWYCLNYNCVCQQVLYIICCHYFSFLMSFWLLLAYLSLRSCILFVHFFTVVHYLYCVSEWPVTYVWLSNSHEQLFKSWIWWQIYFLFLVSVPPLSLLFLLYIFFTSFPLLSLFFCCVFRVCLTFATHCFGTWSSMVACTLICSHTFWSY